MIIDLNTENFQNEVISSNQPVLVDFWAQWCGPCKALKPAVEQIAQEYQDKIKVGKLNIEEAQDHYFLWREWGTQQSARLSPVIQMKF